MQRLAKSLAPVFLLAAFAQAESTNNLTLSGPYTHENLTVFLVHSSTAATPAGLLPLKQAMEQKKVVVYETGQVNELAIENKSAEAVFVQGGDIVKGGQQDRVFTTDMILPAKSGRVPIATFCVEQGRWTKRGAEDAKTFSAAPMALATRESKLAVKSKQNQNEVWASVNTARAQLGLASSVGIGPPSTSMQIALEDRSVAKSTEPYQHALAKLLDSHSDAIGAAFAINGELNSADIYFSPALFRQLWPKLLNSIAVEASSSRTPGKTFAAIDSAAVEAALAAANGGKESAKPVNSRTVQKTRESDKLLLFESQDPSTGWIHRNYVVK